MNSTMRLVCGAVVAVFTVAGCGRGGGEGETAARSRKAAAKAATPTPAPSADTKSPAGPAAGPTVTLTGKVTLTGTPPPPTPIKMDADANCSAAHSDSPPVSQEVVVNAAGMLANVFVFVRNGLEGKTFPTSTDSVVLNQRGCMYEPHVLGMMANQPLNLVSSDPTLHNVHAHPQVEGNKEFNLGMTKPGVAVTRTFARPEIMIPVKCDVHPWMLSYIGVLEHPFFAVSDADGRYTIPNLPPGTYTIETWHERFGAQSRTITVGETPKAELDFAYQSTGS